MCKKKCKYERLKQWLWLFASSSQDTSKYINTASLWLTDLGSCLLLADLHCVPQTCCISPPGKWSEKRGCGTALLLQSIRIPLNSTLSLLWDIVITVPKCNFPFISYDLISISPEQPQSGKGRGLLIARMLCWRLTSKKQFCAEEEPLSLHVRVSKEHNGT